jgi:hypothetical protein
MSVNDAGVPSPSASPDAPPFGSPTTLSSQRLRSRRYLLVATVLIVVVIAVSTVAHSGVSKSIPIAQHHYLHDVAAVEEADVTFNGGGSTPPDHSPTSTRALDLALGKEFNLLHEQKWPKVAAVDIAHLATYTRAQYLLLLDFSGAPNAKRSRILSQQSVLLNEIESTNTDVLRELKLPTPINARRSVAPPKKVP